MSPRPRGETTMQSNNPVFRRSAEFQAPGRNAYGNQTYAGNGSSYQGYGQAGYSDPSSWGVGTPGSTDTTRAVDRGPMTVDSVVQKTGISLAVVIVAALATWILTPAIEANEQMSQVNGIGTLYAAITIGS